MVGCGLRVVRENGAWWGGVEGVAMVRQGKKSAWGGQGRGMGCVGMG